MKIRRAEKNFKEFFNAIKKVIEKPDEELVWQSLEATCGDAKFAEKGGKFINYLFAVFKATRKEYKMTSQTHINVPQNRIRK